MILKQNPEDFFVEELTSVQAAQGPYAWYRLEKRGWATPDALQVVRRRWKIDHRRLAYGGLKDRHAHTIQYFSIFRGPQRNLRHQRIEVDYLGQIDAPYSSDCNQGNRFRLVLRAFHPQELDSALGALDEVKQAGLANYFDDQRFGSVTADGVFLAKHIILGEHEKALKQALTASYEFDRQPQKHEKQILRDHWGDWAACKERLPRCHARSLVDFLVSHPDDFRGALARMRPELRGLYLSAYQSHLWNRILAGWLRGHCVPEKLIALPLRTGSLPTPRPGVDLDQLRELRLPLPSHRVVWDENDTRRAYFDRVLNEEGLSAEDFKLKRFREMFFSRGERAAWLLPVDLAAETAPDGRHSDKRLLRLGFELPRGSYATLLVKRLSAGA
ncbi:MAG: tRNA pseudouridine(13) synthase TruD [Acidobacteriales bacterium]|nr:tRNA pseudouridine(13) synthase TruD [Terriglobales bacterium]